MSQISKLKDLILGFVELREELKVPSINYK